MTTSRRANRRRVSRIDEAGFQRRLDAYITAWTTYGDEIGALFSEDAEYRYDPWDEPVEGQAAIVADWLENRDDPDSWTAEYRPWAVDDDEGRCRELTELYARRG